MPKPKKPLPAAQSAEAAAKVAAAKDSPKTKIPEGKRETSPAATSDRSDHDLLEEIKAGYAKVAKIETEIQDLKGKAKARREALATANRELRFLLAGQRALPFSQKAGKVEKLDTVDKPKGSSSKAGGDEEVVWYEVREIGSNRHLANYPAGHPHLDDFRKRQKDYVVRQLSEPPATARADVTGSGTLALAKAGPAPDGKPSNVGRATA